MIKKLIGQIALLTGISVLVFNIPSTDSLLTLSTLSTRGELMEYTVAHPEKDKIEEKNDAPGPFSLMLGKSYVGFKEALAFKESQGNYFSVNDFGYLGKYQFGKETLKLIGIHNPNQFLYDPALQESAFIANLERNKWVLRRDIKSFTGKRINGILITESGILAAAHLAGPGGVKKYLRSYGEQGFSDAFGTSIQYYMKRFSGYDTSFITPNKKAKVEKA